MAKKVKSHKVAKKAPGRKTFAKRSAVKRASHLRKNKRRKSIGDDEPY
jgi:hypothetical protein